VKLDGKCKTTSFFEVKLLKCPFEKEKNKIKCPPKNNVVLRKKKKNKKKTKRNFAAGFLRDRCLQSKSYRLQSNVGLALQGIKPAQRVEEVFHTNAVEPISVKI
jgi:hypothetical protein